MAILKPFLDDHEGIPDQFAVNDLCSGCSYNTDDCAERKEQRENGKLDVLSSGRASVTREIGDVTSEGGPGASDGGHT